MKKLAKLRPSEIAFLALGVVLFGSSIALMKSHVSFVDSLYPHSQAEDPFQASYSEPAPEPAHTPIPLEELSKIGEDSKQSVFLISPASQAMIAKTGNPESGYSVTFRFEVFPKRTACTFEVRSKNKTVITKELEGSPTGSYELMISLPKPGLYQWRVKTSEIPGELRQLTIRN